MANFSSGTSAVFAENGKPSITFVFGRLQKVVSISLAFFVDTKYIFGSTRLPRNDRVQWSYSERLVVKSYFLLYKRRRRGKKLPVNTRLEKQFNSVIVGLTFSSHTEENSSGATEDLLTFYNATALHVHRGVPACACAAGTGAKQGEKDNK